jgi:uncharacterized protein (TIGR04255 family)
MAQPYKRPPITEAVIEIRFEQPLDKALVDKAHARLRQQYTFSNPHNTVNVQFDLAHKHAEFQEKGVGFRLSSADQADVLVISTQTFAVSRLAPYQGWDEFRPRAESNWQEWKRAVGYQKIQRIGVRYINRIDIPLSEKGNVRLEEYMNIYPQIPEDKFQKMVQFAMQNVLPLGVDECNLTLNIASMPSPLLNHGSFLFDLDIVRTVAVPQNDDEIWKLVETIRTHKNHAFEAGITDKARALFQK